MPGGVRGPESVVGTLGHDGLLQQMPADDENTDGASKWAYKGDSGVLHGLNQCRAMLLFHWHSSLAYQGLLHADGWYSSSGQTG